MNGAFERAFAQVLTLEDVRGFDGRVHTDAGDPGGATKWGVTQGLYSKWFDGSVSEMTEQTCLRIYRAEFWDVQALDLVAGVSLLVAAEVFEAGVNCGAVTAGKFLQRACNAVWRSGESLAVDGAVGFKTRMRVAYIVEAGFETALVSAQNGEQYIHYKNLIEARPWAARFGRGWLQRRLGGLGE